MAKTVTAIGVMRLVEQGLISLGDPADRYLDLPTAPWRSPTIAELLTHHGGVIDPPGSFEPTCAAAPPIGEVMAGLTDAHRGPISVTAEPGVSFAYSDAGYCLIEAMVEAVTGQPFAASMANLVTEPLGLGRTCFFSGDGPGHEAMVTGHDRSGVAVPGGRVHYAGQAASGLWTTAADLATVLNDLGQALTGRRAELLSPDGAAHLLTSPTPGIGLGMFLVGDDTDPWAMTQGWGVGFQGQARIHLATGRTVVVLTNCDPGVPQSESFVGAAMRDRTA